MKIVIIGDMHFGVRGDSSAFLDYNKKFIDDILLPYIDTVGIKTVIQVGDLVDRRKYINFYTANRLRKDFLEPLKKRNLDVHLLAGNHDCFFKNTNEINALRELIEDRYPFKIYDQYAEEVVFDNTSILMVPWICDANRNQIMSKIKETTSQIVMGHLEIQGFEMYKGLPSEHGDDRNIFSKFDMVMSGHFHHRSTDGTVFYLGSHGEFTWADYDDPRGFSVFDTETRELNFIRNPYSMFAKIFYDDENKTIEEIVIDFNYNMYKDIMVKVIIKNKTNPYWFDMFIEKLEHSGVADLQIVEDHLNLDIQEDEEIINEAEDTLTVFKNVVDKLSNDSINKNTLNNIFINLYNEALSIK